MPIRFAAACRGESATIARALTVPRVRDAANDNVDGLCRDALLRAALRHFAEHGMAAAGQARDNAVQARRVDDREGYQHWLEICRALDRRMAATLTARKPRPSGRTRR
ncbi:MAG: hypothetical protein KGL44_09625 [Sphingomonadales bacterium]|nr:hypothetical protein [Sphingomonadales bacterium]